MKSEDKLPKWAQELITDIRRERDVALRELNKYCDEQTPSRFYIDDMVCTGETCGPSVKRRNIQSNKMTVSSGGVLLDILIRDGVIELSYGFDGGRIASYNGDVALVPTSYQKLLLVPINGERK